MEVAGVSKDLFPCSGCGCCCRRAKHTVALLNITDPQNEFYFPYKFNEDGSCEMLNVDNKCSVYENRPTVCNIDKTILLAGLNKEQFYRDVIESCNKAMDEDNISVEFRIK